MRKTDCSDCFTHVSPLIYASFYSGVPSLGGASPLDGASLGGVSLGGVSSSYDEFLCVHGVHNHRNSLHHDNSLLHNHIHVH